MKTKWNYIALYIVLAIAIAAPTHLGYTKRLFQVVTEGTIFVDWTYMVAGIGTLFAAFIAMFFHKDLVRNISIFADNVPKNTLIFFLPVFAFSIMGLQNPYDMNIHLFGFLYAFTNVIYAFFEEFGWRVYLQNALVHINKHAKYMLIGVVWWIWHLRYVSDFDIYIFPLICIGGGYFLGKLADDTKSVMPIVCMHTLIILMTNTGGLDTHKIIGGILIIVGWFVIEQWDKRRNKVLL